MCISQWSQISQFIRFQIDVFDEKFTDDPEVEMEDSQPDTMKQGSSFKLGHIFLGAMQKHCSFEQISVTHANDLAFSQYENRFSQFLCAQSEFTVADLDMILEKPRYIFIIWAHG